MRYIISLLLVPVMMMAFVCTPSYGASGCVVKYYYTSQQNPEGVPTATSASISGNKWKIRPASPSRTVYTSSRNGRTVTYTFDGWYTNINCMGARYAPGKETTAITPSGTSGRYTVSLYGRWIYKDTGAPSVRSTSAAASKADSPASSKAQSAGQTKTSTAARTGTSTSASAPAQRTDSGKYTQTIYSISACTFADKGQTKSLEAKASSGLHLAFTSANPKVVSVDAAGTMKSMGAGSTVVRITQKGDEKYEPVETTVPVSVAGYRSRDEAMYVWRHLLIDTFFHINGRKYSFGAPGKYWTDSKGAWSGKTGRKGNTQSCLTLPNVSLKRAGILSRRSGNVWLTSNMATKPNRTVRRLKKTSSMVCISYPHKSLKTLARKGKVRYGDILCRSGHTFIYMGKDSKGHPLVYESGTRRDIGNGTGVTWGHHSGGHANKLTGKINKQIRRSDAVGAKWRRGQISDASFRGHKAAGNNLNRSIHIVCSIRTFTVRTSCVNGTISLGNTYMAGQNVSVNYAPCKDRTISTVTVDGKKISASAFRERYTFKKLSANHSIHVVYK